MNRIIGDEHFGSVSRQRIFRYAVMLLALIFILRLGWLQIVQGGAYRLKAEAQAIKQIKIEPFRGMMFDRHGRAIVQNVGGFSIIVTPYEFTEVSRQRLSKLLGVSDSAIAVEVAKAARLNKFSPFKISFGRDVPNEILALIEEQREWLPGVDVITDPKRYYAFDGNAAHLLGYTREVSEDELQRFGDAYDPGDITGKVGLERSYESYIRGQKGFEFVAVNNRGQRVASFNDRKSDIQAREGFDLYLGMDADVQVLAEKALQGKRGAVVALDPRNGEIIAFASMPDFDLRELTGRTTRSYFNQLFRDPEKPLLNRGSISQYPPGSTWKMLVAIACLEEGLITPQTRLSCSGAYYYGNRSMACHGAHGAITVERAIQASCNVFFAQCGMKLGPDLMEKWGERFGFGARTLADISEEKLGLVPSTAYMDKVYGERGWSKYAAANWGIGQGELLVTPLQMARYTAALANGGTLFQPHAVRAIQNKALGRKQWVAYDSTDLQISAQTMEIVRQGMYLVVNQPGGTAGNVKLPTTVVCGKTGTAQNPHGKDHSWFVAFAPMENPTIAVCAMVENAGFGSTVAAPIVRDVINLYLNRVWPDGMKPTGSDSLPTPADSAVLVKDEIPIQGPFLVERPGRRTQPAVAVASSTPTAAVAAAPSGAARPAATPSDSRPAAPASGAAVTPKPAAGTREDPVTPGPRR